MIIRFPHLLFVFIFICASGRAQVSLNIGPTSGSTVNTVTTHSGAIGTENTVSGTRALAIGRQNQLTWGQNFAVGYLNTVGIDRSAAFGYNNTVYGPYSVAIGTSNYFSSSSEEGSSNNSLAVGNANYLSYTSGSALVAGYNNVMTGWNGVAAGSGLINAWNSATIVGSYNDSTITDALRFAVGNGSDANNRSNAFEVYADGRIRMSRQGDVGMGRFTTITADK